MKYVIVVADSNSVSCATRVGFESNRLVFCSGCICHLISSRLSWKGISQVSRNRHWLLGVIELPPTTSEFHSEAVGKIHNQGRLFFARRLL